MDLCFFCSCMHGLGPVVSCEYNIIIIIIMSTPDVNSLGSFSRSLLTLHFNFTGYCIVRVPLSLPLLIHHMHHCLLQMFSAPPPPLLSFILDFQLRHTQPANIIVSGVLLILPIIDFAPAAPVTTLEQEKRHACVDKVHILVPKET